LEVSAIAQYVLDEHFLKYSRREIFGNADKIQ